MNHAIGRRFGVEKGVLGGVFARFKVQYMNSWTELPYIGNEISSNGVSRLGGG